MLTFIICRRRAANRALKPRPGISRSLSSLSGQHLPPAPNVPPPKVPTAPSKGDEYVGLNGDHVTYKSPPGSIYTTLDSKSHLHGIKVLPDPLQVKVFYEHANQRLRFRWDFFPILQSHCSSVVLSCIASPIFCACVMF